MSPIDGAGRPRLLIADDDPVVQSILSMSLEGAFDVVGVASDSEQAVELAAAHQPDVAIVDVVMPKGGGFSAVPGIREVSPETAIVVLSGDELEGVVRDLLMAGASAYCRKGATPAVLTDLLMQSIDARAGERVGQH
jgi:DNA-binding NarL/FixJ family response regulator